MTTSANLSQAFRDAFRCHPAGVAIITADPGDGPVALTVSSLISVSADPPTVAFSVSSRSGPSAAMLRAETVVLHLLQYSNLALAKYVSTPGADRFGATINWERLPTGEPRYADVATWFRARIIGALPVDGASLIAAELLEGRAQSDHATREEETLIYMDRRWLRLSPDPARLTVVKSDAEHFWF